MPKVHPLYLEALGEHFEVHPYAPDAGDEALKAVAPRIVGLAGGGESVIPGSLLQQLPQLKVVSIFGVGYDGVDVQAALARQVPVTHTPEVLTDDVADLAMGLVLSVARQIPQADQHVRQGRWPQGAMPLGRKVSGARMGIVGLGRIGKAIAQRAQAFGMSVSYTARTEKADSGFAYFPTAAALAAHVDFLALREGRIAGAALDVVAEEPLPQDSPLWDMPNVLITPHTAGETHSYEDNVLDMTMENIERLWRGEQALFNQIV